VGLVRVGMARRWAKLAFVGVRPGHRRRGLGRAMVPAAFRPLRDDRIYLVLVEADRRTCRRRRCSPASEPDERAGRTNSSGMRRRKRPGREEERMLLSTVNVSRPWGLAARPGSWRRILGRGQDLRTWGVAMCVWCCRRVESAVTGRPWPPRPAHEQPPWPPRSAATGPQCPRNWLSATSDGSS
jgi:hypothetical protein